MKKIICNTRFRLNSFADGGSKRSVQIREMLADNGFAFEDDKFQICKRIGGFQLIRMAFRSIGFILNNCPKRKRSIGEYVRLIKYFALRIPGVVDKYEDQDVVFLWETTQDNDLVYLMKANGHPVIGMPHNIESLVVRGNLNTLNREVESLKKCDVVFGISKEETWLLRLLGANAYYLPYFPPKEVESFLLSIRDKREKRSTGLRKSFLLLGSVTNPPTKEGMQSMIDFFGKSSLPFELNVAGYKTESLRIIDNSMINFYGTVSNSMLEKILCETDAVLVYQPPTTGALTRIPEMLVAGIPVFVNFDASRNYFNMTDVRLYDTFDDLMGMLMSFEHRKVIPYTQDNDVVNRFLGIIKELALR